MTSKYLGWHTAQILWIQELACWGLKDSSGQVAPLVVANHDDSMEEGGFFELMKIERVIGNFYQNPELLT